MIILTSSQMVGELRELHAAVSLVGRFAISYGTGLQEPEIFLALIGSKAEIEPTKMKGTRHAGHEGLLPEGWSLSLVE
jgi:hypothetical protein